MFHGCFHFSNSVFFQLSCYGILTSVYYGLEWCCDTLFSKVETIYAVAFENLSLFLCRCSVVRLRTRGFSVVSQAMGGKIFAETANSTPESRNMEWIWSLILSDTIRVRRNL